jgi:hypothetical protein
VRRGAGRKRTGRSEDDFSCEGPCSCCACHKAARYNHWLDAPCALEQHTAERTGCYTVRCIICKLLALCSSNNTAIEDVELTFSTRISDVRIYAYTPSELAFHPSPETIAARTQHTIINQRNNSRRITQERTPSRDGIKHRIQPNLRRRRRWRPSQSLNHSPSTPSS